MSNAQVLLDWQLLKAWAQSKPAHSDVGLACTNSECPLARYLSEATGRHWSVGPSIRVMDGSGDHLDKTSWVQSLIERVDDVAGHHTITREQFLKCLEEVKPQEP